jgi:hypothetical protein
VNHHRLAIDVADLELLGFGATQPSAVQSGKQRTMFQVHRSVEQGTNFLSAQNGGQLPTDFRLGNLGCEPVPSEGTREEKLQCCDANLDR